MRGSPLLVSRVCLTTVGKGQIARGLLGYVSCTLNDGVRLDGITLRRTAAARLTLSFPARWDRFGRQHPYIRPIDTAARRAIEQQIFDALQLQGVLQ